MIIQKFARVNSLDHPSMRNGIYCSCIRGKCCIRISKYIYKVAMAASVDTTITVQRAVYQKTL